MVCVTVNDKLELSAGIYHRLEFRFKYELVVLVSISPTRQFRFNLTDLKLDWLDIKLISVKHLERLSVQLT